MIPILKKLDEWWRYFKFLCNHHLQLAPEHHSHLIELLSLMTPYRADGIRKRRIGISRDGGYVMLDDFKSVKGAYSLGIGHDVSWDIDLAKLGIPILQFDYSIEKPPQDHPLFTFFPIRIGTTSDSSAQVESIASIVERHHPLESDLILKVDIEGAEWEVFATMDSEALMPFRQIIVELHQLHFVADAAWREQAMRAITHLTRYHLPVHMHGNNLDNLLISKDIRIPDTLELTFARRNSYKLAPTDEVFPGPYDKSNSLILRDVKIETFRFSGRP